jgi:hypothetical protein
MTDTPNNSAAEAPAADAQRTNSPFHQAVPPRVEAAREAFQPVRPSTPPTPPTDAEYDRWTSAQKQEYARTATAAASAGTAPATTSESKPDPSGNIGTVGIVSLGELADDGSPRFKIGEGDSAIDISEKQLRELMVHKASEDSRRATLPADPSGYELKLPADLKLPDGVKFEFNDKDPILGPTLNAARAFALENSFDQGQFEKMLGLYAGAQANEAAKIADAARREREALGPAGTARVTAVNQWLDGMGAGNLKARMWTAADVGAFEKLMSKFVNGGTTFNTLHRDVPDAGNISDAQWAKMSFAERTDYARSHPQP